MALVWGAFLLELLSKQSVENRVCKHKLGFWRIKPLQSLDLVTKAFVSRVDTRTLALRHPATQFMGAAALLRLRFRDAGMLMKMMPLSESVGLVQSPKACIPYTSLIIGLLEQQTHKQTLLALQTRRALLLKVPFTLQMAVPTSQ